MIFSLGLIADTKEAFAEHADVVPRCILFRFKHDQFYKVEPHQDKGIELSVIELSVAMLINENTIHVGITNEHDAFCEFNNDADPAAQFNTQLNRWDVNAIDLLAPWQLQTQKIKKPWGQEIWYTGIEARGVCCVNGTPLPWLLELDKNTLSGQQSSDILLLKILDPLPDNQYGELYFEVHEQKIEVYVVTHIDADAWPSGIGQIRYGFNPIKRALYDNDTQFKSAYLSAVEDYQSRRNQIDDLLENKKLAEGSLATDVISPEQQRMWLDELPNQLVEEEITLRKKMYEFTQLRPLEVGDVIQVKPWVPHSLQNGVRVIEFQTAHYERHILSFTQKVMTQSHWDTVAVLDKVNVETDDAELEIISSSKGVLVEAIAQFAEFSAVRTTLKPGHEYVMNIEHYAVVIGVAGDCAISQVGELPDLSVDVEQAYLIPGTTSTLTMVNNSDKDAIILCAFPNIP